MNRASSAAQATPETAFAHIYPTDLQPALQDALAILADIDFRFAQQREQLAHWNGPETAKRKLADDIDREHQRAREPYVHLLAELQRRIMALMGCPSPH